jgi:hypothetical protein
MQTVTSVDNGKHDARQTPTWRPELLSYDAKELRVLTFPNDDAVYAAIDLLWTPPFRGMPFDLAAGACVIIPEDGVRLFAESGLQFTADSLISKEELSPAERRELNAYGPF